MKCNYSNDVICSISRREIKISLVMSPQLLPTVATRLWLNIMSSFTISTGSLILDCFHKMFLGLKIHYILNSYILGLMTMCPNFSLHRWRTTQWTLDWLCVTPDKTNPFSFCITEKLTFLNVCYFPSPGNVSLQYKIFSWEKSVPNTNRIIMVMRLAEFLFGRYRMGLLVSSSLYSVPHSHIDIDILCICSL